MQCIIDVIIFNNTIPDSKLSANCRQIGTKFTQNLVSNTMPSVSAISLCFADKTCGHNLTANCRRKTSKVCVTQFDVKLLSKSEQGLCTQINIKLLPKSEQDLRTPNCPQKWNLFINSTVITFEILTHPL